ncbi:leucine-rich repeat protein [Anaerosporobacter faecicola]|uniref:leucine-rich repeat protein n=1 Tax=Anaerosporobacter faecicola TaxID=2718714 RepID=UPI001438D4DF|nr:leucine-rich repeat protein [Anaerosporobacter faecicola]
MEKKIYVRKTIAILVIGILMISSLNDLHILHAQEYTMKIDGFTYEYIKTSDSTCSITKIINKSLNQILTIPERINGYEVKSIGSLIINTNVFGNDLTKDGDYSNNITEIIIPEGMEEIGEYAFARLSKLTNIKFPKSLRVLRRLCFAGTDISELTLDDNISTLEKYCFENCKNLKEVTIGSGIKTFDQYFFSADSITKLNINCEVIGYGAMADLYGNRGTLEEVNFGPNVKIIEDSAFYQQSHLSKVTFGDSIDVIGKYVFYKTNIKNVTLPSSLKLLGSNCLNEVSNIKILSKDVEILQDDQNTLTLGSSKTDSFIYGYTNSTTEIYCENMKNKGNPINFISLGDANNCTLSAYEQILERVRAILQVDTNEDILAKIEANKKYEEVEIELKLAKERINKLEIELANTISEIEKVRNGTESSIDKEEIEELKKRQIDYSNEIARLNEQVTSLSASIAGKDITISNLVTVLSTLSSNIGSANAITSRYEQQLTQIRNELGLSNDDDIIIAIKNIKNKLSDLESKNEKLSFEKDQLVEQLEKETKEKEELDAFINEVKELVQEDTNQDTLDKISENVILLEEQEEEMSRLKKNELLLEEKLTETNQKIDKLQLQLSDLEKVYNESGTNDEEKLLEKVESLSNDIEQLTLNNENLVEQINNQQIKVDNINTENKKLNTNLLALNTVLSRLNKTNSELVIVNNNLLDEHDKLVSENLILNEENEKLSNEYKSLEEQIQELEKQVQELDIINENSDNTVSQNLDEEK